MDDQETRPLTGNPRMAGSDRLGWVLAAVTAVTVVGALLGIPGISWRDGAIPFAIAFATFTAGVGGLIAFRGDAAAPPRVRRLRFIAIVAFFVLALVSIGVVISRAAETDSRPVLTAVATGDGPTTISGTADAGGLAPTERLSIKVVDQGATLFQAVAGPASETARVAIPFEIQVNSRPNRDLMIVAWLTDRVTGEPTCADSSGSHPDVTCLKLTLHGPPLIAPVLTISPNLTPGARSVMVSLDAIVGPEDGVQVNLWDREALVHSFIARPGPDGRIHSTTTVPMHDNRAVLCAVATIAAEASPTAVPSPCIGPTFTQLIIPGVPSPSLSTSPAASNPAPSASSAAP
jgi:hypothetical protein